MPPVAHTRSERSTKSIPRRKGFELKGLSTLAASEMANCSVTPVPVLLLVPRTASRVREPDVLSAPTRYIGVASNTVTNYEGQAVTFNSQTCPDQWQAREQGYYPPWDGRQQEAYSSSREVHKVSPPPGMRYDTITVVTPQRAPPNEIRSIHPARTLLRSIPSSRPQETQHLSPPSFAQLFQKRQHTPSDDESAEAPEDVFLKRIRWSRKQRKKGDAITHYKHLVRGHDMLHLEA